MHRLTARFLLFIALVGTLAPLALAAATPIRACCVRKAIHHCHGALAPEQISETGQLVVNDSSCCNHDCGRAVTQAQWAQAQPPATTALAPNVEAYVRQSTQVSPNTEVSLFQSTRGPPILS
jgi:hypothetical protein